MSQNIRNFEVKHKELFAVGLYKVIFPFLRMGECILVAKGSVWFCVKRKLLQTQTFAGVGKLNVVARGGLEPSTS